MILMTRILTRRFGRRILGLCRRRRVRRLFRLFVVRVCVLAWCVVRMQCDAIASSAAMAMAMAMASFSCQLTFPNINNQRSRLPQRKRTQGVPWRNINRVRNSV